MLVCVLLHCRREIKKVPEINKARSVSLFIWQAIVNGRLFPQMTLFFVPIRANYFLAILPSGNSSMLSGAGFQLTSYVDDLVGMRLQYKFLRPNFLIV
jgi:hypothetical protein